MAPPNQGVSTAIMREWGGLDWAAFIALWITVALSAADQALRLMPELSASIRPRFERTPFFMRIAVAFAPILLLTFATGVFLVDAIWPARESAPQTPSTKTAAIESIESALASAKKTLEDTRSERDQFQQQLVSMQAARSSSWRMQRIG
jgi:hypothetical protein